jgi:hypothetical protein
MDRGLTRCVAASLAGASGLATAAAITALPPGAGHGSPGTLALDVLGAPLFWLVLPIVFFGLALMLYASCSALSECYGVPLDMGRRVVQPMGWGLSLPLLALLIDPWSFGSSVLVLVFTGSALGTMAVWRGYRRLLAEAADASVVPEVPDMSVVSAASDASPASDALRTPGSSRTPGVSRASGATSGESDHLRSSRLIIALVAVAIPTFLVVMGPSWWPALSGDEPHYLLYARSIWVEGDIDLGADYTDGVYRSFYPPDLPPHTKPGADPATRYSTHGIGTAVLLVPWYAMGGGLSIGSFTLLVRFSMALWLGAFALILFELLRDIAGVIAARRGTLLAVLTAPLIFVAPHLFPDLPALTLSATAYLILRRKPGLVGALAAGSLIALLPWLGVKFFAMAAALTVVGAVMLMRSAQHRWSLVSGFVAPIIVSAAAHMTFTWVLYGRLSPLAIYHGGTATGLRPVGQGENLLDYLLDVPGALQSAIGLLIDQRHGLLMVAPQYLLAVAGFAWLWRRRRSDFWALIMIFLAHWGIHALSQEMPGWSTSGRPLVGALWTLAIPMGAALAYRPSVDRAGSLFAACRATLVAVGVSLTALLLAQPHLLYHDFGIQYSLLLLRYGAPGLQLWKLFPLWVHFEDPQWLVSILWLIGTIGVGVLLWRLAKHAEPGLSVSEMSLPAADPLSLDPEASLSDVEPVRAAGNCQPATAYRAAQLVFVSLAVVLVIRGVFVPVTQLHQPRAYGDLTVWTANSLIEEAWADPDGVWVRGGQGALLVVSSDRPLTSITAEVSGLQQMEATVQLGTDGGGGLVRPGAPLVLELAPGSGRRWQGQRFYLLGVDAPRGISPADLGTDAADRRLLGLYLRILRVQFLP